MSHCLKGFLKRISGWFFIKKDTSEALSHDAYYKRFIGDFANQPPTNKYNSIPPKAMKRIEEAYKKSWECRNFEIDKFWTRSAFFWGFIALIFTGYISLITNGDKSSYTKIEYLDFYFMLLGFLFSLAWLLVIKGSKAWQENWEAHIDYLEDYISGPLYKTVWLSKQYKYYSVSKINEVLAIIIIFVWVGIIAQYVSQRELCIPFLSSDWKVKMDFHISICLFITFVFSIVLLFGYPAGKYGFTRESLEKIDRRKEKEAMIIRKVVAKR
jgi:hypothetical protein